MRDPSIRTYGLTVLTIMLTAAVLLVSIITGALPVAIGFMLSHLPATAATTGGITAASVAGTIFKRRRARRRAIIAPPGAAM